MEIRTADPPMMMPSVVDRGGLGSSYKRECKYQAQEGVDRLIQFQREEMNEIY
ncbi:hypothetical protein QJS10_CPA03g00209 [Acorus calamus]|uniref:Uncharacterized protein n=1 Tax=Acorus calamus TaxID=4465 RepID=A0AAV9F989_ACOCL|nr:hypothetical protein QJS10_CPA03g00209 [Acorus calamus]